MKEIKDPDLAALLAAAAAPEPDPDERGLEAVLVAYRAAALEYRHAPSTERPPSRRPARGGQLLKFAAAIVLLVGGGVAAASAGALPDSIQRIAHDYLGGVGVPAPGAGVSPSAQTSASPNRSRTASPSATLSAAPATSSSTAASLAASSSPTASAAPSAGTSTESNDLMTLCRIVVQAGKSWHSKVDAAQHTTLVNAAGADPQVLPYCTNLINGGPSNSTNSTPPSAAPSPSPSPSKGHGGGDGDPSAGLNNAQH